MTRPSRHHALLALALVATACDDRDIGPLPIPAIETPVRFAVRHSDFSNTSISLLDDTGAILADDYITSGATRPGLTLAIGGDTDMPTVSEPGVLTIIDRYGSDVVTRIRLADGIVLGQVRTQGESNSGFSSNPQDVLVIDRDSAWVSRYSHNTMTPVVGDVRGSDLLGVDPSTMTRTNGRIDLVTLEETVDSFGTEMRARARPKKIVRVGNFAAVGVDLITDDYSVAAPGKLAIVDVRNGALSSVDLPDFTNCGNLAPVPGHETYVAVMCQGYNYPNREAESGLVIVSIDPVVGTVTEIRRYATADYLDEDYVFDAFEMIDEDEFVGIHLGGYRVTDPPDSLVHVRMVDGSRTTLFTSEKGSQLFVEPAFDPSTGLLLVPDTSAGVRRFQRGEDGSFTQGELIVLVGHGLPTRAVALLR